MRKVRALLAALHPPGGPLPFGGVQSWCETIAKAFQERGIETEFWGPKRRLPKTRFDYAIVANAAKTWQGGCLAERVVNVSHGVIPEERPHPNWRAAFTSEEVRKHWGRSGALLPQPIDLDFWTPDEGPRDGLLFYSYRSESDLGLAETAERLGLRFTHIRRAGCDNARDEMRRSAVVFASGRAALEAMATGAPTVICDHRDYNGGPLLEPDLEKAAQRNYSGRGGVDPASVDLVAIAEAAMLTQTPREYVEKNHDYRKVADKLLSLLC